MYMIDCRTGKLDVFKGTKQRKMVLNLSLDAGIYSGSISSLSFDIETAGVYSVDMRYIYYSLARLKLQIKL